MEQVKQSKIEQVERSEGDICCICLENLNFTESKGDVVSVSCNHKYHNKCLLEHAISSTPVKKCPMCRSFITLDCYNIYSDDESYHMKNYIIKICASPAVLLAYMYKDYELVYYAMRRNKQVLFVRDLTITEQLAEKLQEYMFEFYKNIIKRKENYVFRRKLDNFCNTRCVEMYEEAVLFFQDNPKNFGEFTDSKEYIKYRTKVHPSN